MPKIVSKSASLRKIPVIASQPEVGTKVSLALVEVSLEFCIAKRKASKVSLFIRISLV